MVQIEVIRVEEILLLMAFPGLLICLFVGTWILWPLDRAASRRRGRIQFTVIDFMGLVFLLQLPMALIKSSVGSDTRNILYGSQMTLYVLAWIATLLVWWRSVVVFSRAGVTRSKDRALTVFLVLPMAYLGTFAVPVLLYAAFVGRQSVPRRVALVFVATVIGVGVLCAGVVSRRVANRTAHQQGGPAD